MESRDDPQDVERRISRDPQDHRVQHVVLLPLARSHPRVGVDAPGPVLADRGAGFASL